MIPSFESFLLPMLRLHSDCKDRLATDSTNELSKIMGFTKEDWKVMTRSGNKSQIADRCYWSLTYLKQAGLLEQPSRSHYQITVAGLELLERPIEQLDRHYLEENYPSFLLFSKERKRKKSENIQNDDITLFDDNSSIEETIEENHNMTLDEIYTLIDLSRKAGWKITPEQDQKANELEEQLIKQSILPMLVEKIAPALSPIRRELVLVVDYKPGSPLSVRLSRKRNLVEVIDAKVLELDPVVEHVTRGPNANKSQGRAANTRLRVTMPDGRVIDHSSAIDTLTEVIQIIGPMRVRELGISYSSVPLVSNRKDTKYAQREIPGGLYIMTHTGTDRKKKQIDEIAERLQLNIKVEII